MSLVPYSWYQRQLRGTSANPETYTNYSTRRSLRAISAIPEAFYVSTYDDPSFLRSSAVTRALSAVTDDDPYARSTRDTLDRLKEKLRRSDDYWLGYRYVSPYRRLPYHYRNYWSTTPYYDYSSPLTTYSYPYSLLGNTYYNDFLWDYDLYPYRSYFSRSYYSPLSPYLRRI